MSITERKGFRYHCDVTSCGTHHDQEGATGHYTESTPPGWVRVKIVAPNVDGDFRGGGLLAQDVLLCPDHGRNIREEGLRLRGLGAIRS